MGELDGFERVRSNKYDLGVAVIQVHSIRGENFSRLVGVASLALAVATIWIPGLAPGFRME